jgi:capsular exopolysaccharide synthesis family protein
MNVQSNAELQFGPEAAGNAPYRNQGIDLGDMLRILSERRYIIIGAAIVGLLLGIAASLMMTPMYRATALLELNSPANQVLDEAGGRRGAQSVDGQEMLATQLGLLRSDSLARRVVQELNLVSRPDFGGTEGSRQQRTDRAVKVLQNNTTVEGERGSLLMKVAEISPDPVLAARIANALAQGFIASSLERRYDSSSYARDFLRNQLAATKASLEDSERQLNAYALQTGILRAPAQLVNGTVVESPSISATDLTALNLALNDARVRRITAEQAYRSGGGQSNAAQMTMTAGIREQRALLKAEYDEKAKLFKEDYPEMRQLASRIAALDRSVAAEAGVASRGKSSDLAAEFKAAEQAEAALAAKVASAKSVVQDERSRSIQYNILQREVDTNRALYDALLQRYKEIGVAGGIGQSNVSMVDEAEPPQSPYRPVLPLNAGIGLVGGLALGVLLAVAAHLLFDNIVTPADVRAKLGLPVLGVVPQERDGRPLFEAIDDRKSAISEAYYSVRTALRFAEPDGVPHSLLVTSSRPGEGKSTSAYAIAASFARTGEKVLLIDADLRKPTFVSQQSEGRGLAYLLSSEEPLANYVEPTKTENLSLLPVGRYSGSAAELLASVRLNQIVAEAKRAYALVVLDGPPVLGLADAPLLGALAERTIIVIESREARTGAVSEMIRRLQASGTRIIGAILTKAKGDGSGYGYNYYSYSYGTGDRGGKVSSDPARKIDLATDAARPE